MRLEFPPLANDIVSLEHFAPALEADVRTAIDCDPEAWSIMPVNPTGERFEDYWKAACSAPVNERVVYAIRRRADGLIVGTSTFYTGLSDQGGLEIGTTYLRPDARSGTVNPATKLLMLGHAFDSGMVRVQFRVDTRNLRSQAAVTKLGAVREGVLRKDRLTWTGYVRDTVYFSILAHEWPAVRDRLVARICA